MVSFILTPHHQLIYIFLTGYLFARVYKIHPVINMLNTFWFRIFNFFIGLSTVRHGVVQVEERCHKDLENLCPPFDSLMTCKMGPNQVEWIFWSIFAQLLLPDISLPLVKGWFLLAKIQIHHHNSYQYRCTGKNIKVPSVIWWVEISPLHLNVFATWKFICFFLLYNVKNRLPFLQLQINV